MQKVRQYLAVAIGMILWMEAGRYLPYTQSAPGLAALIGFVAVAMATTRGPTTLAVVIGFIGTVLLRPAQPIGVELVRDAVVIVFGLGAVALSTVRERQFEESRQYQVIFEENPLPMWVYDAQTTAFLRVNQAAIKTYGYSRDEFLRMTLRDVRPSEDIEELEDIVRRGFPDHRATWRHLTKDGRTMEVLVRASSVTVNGTPARLALLEDVTERRDLEVQLRHSQKMEAVGQLAAGIAHDFNNLLAVIQGFATLTLETLPDDDPRRSDLDEVVRAGSRAADLTRQLLAFSRKQLLQMRVLAVADVISEMTPMLERLVGETVQLHTRTMSRGMAKADPGQLQQVLMNLVVNARDAMGGHGDISIELRDVVLDDDYVSLHTSASTGPHVLLTVTDTGCGMSEETQARIFEPFFTTKPSGQGTGLGLSTVYGIVQQFGGHIAVYSELGKGSTFKVYLPRTDESIETVRPQIRKLAANATRTVLLVDDELGVQGVAARILRRAGYIVHTAGRPAEAMAQITEHGLQPDILLTDVVLPDMNGQALADAVLQLRPSCKVVFMSGYTEAAVVRLGDLAAGATFISKPFTAAGLTSTLADLFEVRSEEIGAP